MQRPLFVLLCLLCLGCPEAKEAEPVALPEQPAETLERWDALVRSLRIEVIDTDAEVLTPKAALLELRSPARPTVLAFWATYCPPCIEEMAMFDALHQEGHRVIGVSMDSGNHAGVAEILKKERPAYPQAILQMESMKRVGRALEAGLPFTAVLDAKGRVRVVLSGKASRPAVEAAIEEAS